MAYVMWRLNIAYSKTIYKELKRLNTMLKLIAIALGKLLIE